ncbi:MAG TPA: hypothetical protein VGN14_18095, partial [Candidatus Elarobacter sp.]
LARRIDADLHVVSVLQRDDAGVQAVITELRRAAQQHRATFETLTEADAAAAIVGRLRAGDALVLESPRTKRRFFGKPSFAVRTLAAGAREVLVLAPRAADAQK